MSGLVFHSHAFLFVFLPIAWLAYRATASRPRLQALVLPLAGVAFYWSAGPARLALLLAFTLASYFASPALRLPIAIAQLAVLVAFKLGAVLAPGVAAFALPLGLSFYTFNLVSYALDVRRGSSKPATSLPDFATYATFFPTVSAGPLLRHGDFAPQLAPPRRLDPALFELGVLHLVVGLAKKVLVADPLGVLLEPAFSSHESLGFAGAWLAVLGYAYQLYFDFSGYTDMAIGVAALFGLRVPANFDRPYAAAHITDFWQRWHMSMSQWFRDYLFLPLSRSLLRRTDPDVPEEADRVRSICLVLTMVVIGFWHGATWSFLAWGLYHGLLLAGHARVRRVRGLAIPVPLARALTFLAVLVGWVLLRSPSPDMAVRLWGAMAGVYGAGLGVLGPSAATLAAAVTALLLVTNLPAEAYLLRPEPRGVRSWLLAGLLVLSLLALGERRAFLYVQF